MRTRTRFGVIVLALGVAAPIAVSQAPVNPAPAPAETRMLPAAAAAYAEYQGNVSEVGAQAFKTADEIDRAVNTFGSANLNQLSSGWVSYAAIIAAQNPEFAAAVRAADSDYGRERMMLGFRNDLSYARILKGGEQALQAALAANARDAGRVSAAGAFVKEQSYTLQKTPFGKTKVKDPRATAAKLKTVSASAQPIDERLQKVFSAPDLGVMLASAAVPADGSSVWDKVTVLTASAPGAAFQTLSPVVAAPQNQLKVTDTYVGTANRIVTLAAQYVLAADQTNAEQVKSTMSDPMSLTCLDEAQLSYFGCVSASYTRYELSFCLARHGLRLEGDNIRSIGGCFSEITR